MKRKYRSAIIIAVFIILCQAAFAQANKDLSNLLTPTAVNQHLLPNTGTIKSLGSSAKAWKDAYFGGYVYLAGVRYVSNPGTANTAVGINAGSSIASGSNNVFLGAWAGYVTGIGDDNSFTGAYAGYNNTSGYSNTFAGRSAGISNTSGYGNTVFGDSSHYACTTGHFNSALGIYSLTSMDGYGNAAFGYRAANRITNGNYSCGFGYQALYSDDESDTAYNNTAFGYQGRAMPGDDHGCTTFGSEASGFVFSSEFGFNAGYRGHESSIFGANAVNDFNAQSSAFGANALFGGGDYSIAFGHNALYNCYFNAENTAVGDGALYGNIGENQNTAIGEGAFYKFNNGHHNAAFGVHAGYEAGSNVYVDGGTFIGSYADYPFAFNFDVPNATALGNGATISFANQVRIGNSSVTSVGGFNGWTNISDGRIKKNIHQDVPGMSFIRKLMPVTYALDLDAADKIMQGNTGEDIKTGLSDAKTTGYYDESGRYTTTALSKEEIDARIAQQQTVYTGFVAQEVEQSAKELNYNFSGVDAAKSDNGLYGLRYAAFVPPLVKGLQELDENQNSTFKEQGDKIAALKKANEVLKNRIAMLEVLMEKNTNVTSATNR